MGIQRDSTISSREIVCHFCNTDFVIDRVYPGEQIKCPRCQETLIRIERHPILVPLIYSFLALFSFILCLIFPLLTVTLPYVEQVTTLSIWQLFKYLQQLGNLFLAFIYLFLVIFLPLIFIFTHLYLYLGILFRKKWPLMQKAIAIIAYLRPWMMVDIFFISIIVALIKVNALADFGFGQAMVVLFAYSIFLARLVLASSIYWLKDQVAQIYQQKLLLNKYSDETIKNMAKPKVQLAWALLFTSLIFYVPANILPMMNTEGIGFQPYHSNILQGVISIWNSGDYLISSVIFIASFIIPIFKLFILFILLLSIHIHQQQPIPPKKLTWCYVAIERIGRWSMIDVFVIMLMVSLFHSKAVFISAGSAVFYFCLLVNLTMLATAAIDTRLLWLDGNHKSG
jgi:hypothetical protein